MLIVGAGSIGERHLRCFLPAARRAAVPCRMRSAPAFFQAMIATAVGVVVSQGAVFAAYTLMERLGLDPLYHRSGCRICTSSS
jgi:hypothetical protein